MRLSLFAAVGILALPLAARADLTGNTVHVLYAYPSSGAVFADFGDYAVGTIGAAPGVALFEATPTQIILTATAAPYTPPASFNGFEFTFLNGDPDITGAVLDSSSTATGAVPTFTSDSVDVNLQGLTITAGQTAVIDLTFASPSSVTPEPSSIALLGTGLLGFAGVVRRRFAQ